MFQVEEVRTGSSLLNRLPQVQLTRLVRRMQRVPVSAKQVLHHAHDPIDFAYFLESGIAAILVVLENGASAEVGVVGREGMIGLPIVWGGRSSHTEAMVLTAGTALRISRADLSAELKHNAGLMRLILDFMMGFYAQVSQTAACNGHHTLDQRLARWLLLAHDRSDGDDLELTQEFLSMMLCVHRPAISVAASSLQRVGAIEYHRGRIKIVDRDCLEDSSCECYLAAQRPVRHMLEPTRPEGMHFGSAPYGRTQRSSAHRPSSYAQKH
jgi:CRP-like cAMP-binding protein